MATGLEGPVGSMATKIGFEILKSVAPKGIDKIWTYFFGKELLVIGQARAGKSSFIEYLSLGILEDEHKTAKTTEPEETPLFNIKLVGNSEYKLRVKKVTDTAGQTGPTDHAILSYNFNPDCIIIFLDSTKPNDDTDENSFLYWLNTFFDEYEKLWSKNHKEKENKTRSLTIVLNKFDKIDLDTYNEKEKLIDSYLAKIKLYKWIDIKEVRIMKGVCVNSPYDTKYINGIITAIVKPLLK